MLNKIRIDEVVNKNVHGRTIENAYPLPLFWNHSGVEVNCDGSDLWIDVETNCSFHEPWVAYEINGALMGRQMLLPGEHSLCLFRNMTKGVVKNVRFYRELQAMSEDDDNRVLIKGFQTDGEFKPVEKRAFKLEFIGDSITSGEGTYGATSDTDWLAMYMSSSRHYATIIEKAMNADIRIISQGGWGVYCGWDNDVRHNIPSIYEPVCGIINGEFNVKLGAHNAYDYSSWVPDAIIINLGTNDNSAFNTPPLDVPGYGLCKQRRDENGKRVREDELKVEKAIIDFLKMVRKNNPASHIIWAHGMLGNELEPAIIEAIKKYMDDSNDENVCYLALPNTNDVTVGAHMHPGYLAHVDAAGVLGAYLSSRFGIPYVEKQGNL